MKRMRWISALMLVVSVNAVILAGVVWNRSGSPEATLVLTERELPLAYGWVRSMENSGMALSLQESRLARDSDWFDEAKLRSLGFDPDAYRSTERAQRKRPLSRRAYVSLEFDGPAWEAALRSKEQQVAQLRADVAAGKEVEGELRSAEEELQRVRLSDSRLIAVDAALDPEVLRSRYPDRTKYLITPAELVMSPCYEAHCSEGASGYVRLILTGEIHVQTRYHDLLHDIIGEEAKRWRTYYYNAEPIAPRYRVKLHYGKRYEPWLAELEPLDPKAPKAE